MKVTDEMVTAAREVYLSAEVGAMMNDMIRHMISVAISAAPPSDDYRRGLEDAAKAVREHAEGIEREFGSCMRSQNIRDAESVIAALGGSK
ncbi:hypothetical protein LG047_15630 [Methylocystis sp. WRRC1]|uniref:hypothetical protein n=1 Tax=Methylocystis sp. WRRC1 TaxID=1732014 RepID=UPI001D15B934|nr:hypothetical protein [Methylocystis sp. WRRC1]MCC3246731.1 hypothetical protein [Methylocystis sp. WRRC1]